MNVVCPLSTRKESLVPQDSSHRIDWRLIIWIFLRSLSVGLGLAHGKGEKAAIQSLVGHDNVVFADTIGSELFKGQITQFSVLPMHTVRSGDRNDMMRGVVG